MDLDNAAQALESLGSPTRLAVFRALVKAGPEGLPVGELQTQLDIPGSTLSHHISHLVRNELVAQQRQGRVLRCTANFNCMNELLEFLTRE